MLLVRAGRTNQEIADRLHLTVGTVKWYLTNVYARASVRNRTVLAALIETLETEAREPGQRASPLAVGRSNPL